MSSCFSCFCLFLKSHNKGAEKRLDQTLRTWGQWWILWIFSCLTYIRSTGWVLMKVSNQKCQCCCCSVTQSCPILCDPMDCSTPTGFPVLHYLLELDQTHVHWVDDAIQPSQSLSSPSPPALNHSHHQGLLQWFCSMQQVAKVLELQLQHQSFQWIFRSDLL